MEQSAVDTAVATSSEAPSVGNHRATAPVWIAAVAALVIFLFPMLPYLPAQAKPFDFWVHIEYAKSIHKFADIVSPHFLFQILLIAANRLTGISYEIATVALMSLCYASMAAVIALRIERLIPSLSLLSKVSAAVLVLVASHIFLQSAFSLNFYRGYIAPTVYHNPTQVLSKALAVPVVAAYFMLAFEGRNHWAWRVLLPIGIVLSAVAKPSFLIAFLPCVCAVELYRGLSGSWRLAARNLALVAVPASIALALQFLMTFNGAGEGQGLTFAPFVVYGGSSDVLAKLPASLLFPLVAGAVIWRQRAWSNELRFAWFMYVVGMAISLCVAESGPRMMHGNFAWTGQTVTFLLYVESTIALTGMPWRRAWPAWGAFGLHVLFGVVWYLAAYFLPLGTFL
ncbi:hypothetical protein [Cupriavidus sp. RAF12]|uniref:hypothetical protein n=1 Tax=Cupriavidus sp. RAF12 TaxID=3233050 RepID=UPI003F91B0EF